jgi:UDP-N-acetyl-D-glucosamine dehydrogenase
VSSAINDPGSRNSASDFPEHLKEKISSRQALCAVVGLGVIGTETIRLLAERGFPVFGYDRNPEATRKCAEKLEAVSPSLDLDGGDRLGTADVVFISVRIRCHVDHDVDLSPLRDVGHLLFELHEHEQLIILQSTVPPGVTRKFAQEYLSNGSRHAFYVSHCPERLQPGNPDWRLDNIPRLIGGLDSVAGDLAERMIREICDKPVRVASPEVSEFSKLLENVFIATGVALVGEVTRLAHAHGISATEVTQAADSKPFGYFGFQPGTGVGGHCIPNDLRILCNAADSLGINSSLLDGIAEAVERMPATVVSRIREFCGGVLPANIVITGVGFKIGSADTTESPASALVADFLEAGCTCCYIDSKVPRFDVDGISIRKLSVDEIGSADIGACVIVSGDANVSVRDLCDAISPVLDAGGAATMRDYSSETRLLSL